MATILVAILYFFLFTQSDPYSQEMFVRLLVWCFAFFSLYLYLPSAKGESNFGKVALIHFKSAFTALFYSVVLFLGLLAIYYAIDFLLFNMDEKVVGHLANIVFVFFMPVYYLSLLPKFNSYEVADKNQAQEAAIYPRFLEVLVSYILIPLITAFTIVLISYFLKIVLTRKWPVGQIGPMVLVYSAVGLILYVLSSNLANKFSIAFCRLFPIVLIPLVGLQLVSCYIRINAYGITESRYYVVIFGVFSIISVMYLIFSRAKNLNRIATFACCFAIVSIIPPIDAFNISSNSQKVRIEQILIQNNMLVDQKLIPNVDISDEEKREVTSIVNYMEQMGYLSKLKWFPEEYIRQEKNYNDKLYNDFEKLFGFKQQYANIVSDRETTYINFILDVNQPMDISGFKTMLKLNLYDYNQNEQKATQFSIEGKEYSIIAKKNANGYLEISILDPQGTLVLQIPMEEFLKQVSGKSMNQKNLLPASDLMLEVENDVIRIRIIMEEVFIEQLANGDIAQMHGSMYILATQP
jgi:hypothetical protein